MRALGLLGLLGLGVWASPAHAGEPRLDQLAAERGIAAGELELGRQVAVPAGSTRRQVSAERRSLELHGIPLRGAFETTWTASDGSARVVASRYPAADAQLRPDQRRVELDDARAALAPRLRPDQLRRATQLDGELVYLLVFDRPILTWEFTLPLSMSPTPSRERVWVSAGTGRVLDTVELVDLDNQAEVYEINPQHTPVPSTVTLDNIDLDQQPWAEDTALDGVYLTGSRVRVFNCIDAPDGPYAPWRDDEAETPECYPTQQVVADAEGDFFVPLPDVSLIADNRDPRDLYAELSMYWHAEKFFSFMATLGVETFPCELSNMVANFHWLDPAPAYPELDFGPYNNAYYSGACDIEDGPTMLFGQGSSVDFAFDGDVVYHELGHGIVAELTPEGLRRYRAREDGVLRDARSINEAIADYHSLMITERPELAEYVGFYWAELGRGWIRNAENELQCPRDMTGEEHYDSEPVSAALWAARRRIGSKLDPVVLGMLPLLASDASIEEAAAGLLAVAAAERDAGVWTEGDYEQLERALAGRNLIDCERVVDDPTSLDDPRRLYLRPTGNYVSPFWPGPVQYRQRIPAGSDNLLITFEVSAAGNSAGQPVSHDVDVEVLAKRSSVSEDASIAFSYELGALGHADEEKGDIDETWEVSGDWDEIYTPTTLSEARRQVLIRGLEPGEVVHVSFVNLDRDEAVIRELQFASVPTEELDQGSPSSEPEPELDDDGSSCACTTEPTGGSGGLAAGLLMLLALGPVRSRRRSRPR
ncbi:MYXO-CTERM sorting domain-containing protein [Enhygromyxa salina]|uniref:MYXO-CTERM sorting domain-containing protein n=1 Tax=Enhygromyxa salina TaxID=215803 RepID=UPI0011B273B4|nr:MYXO-CTERM sorting domain-containing protein [Enhygromyxa salina]